MGPLAGLKIVEMWCIVPGPFAGMLLSDMGAEVVRVDRPVEIDYGYPPDRFRTIWRNWRAVAVTGRNLDKIKEVAEQVKALCGKPREIELEVTTWEHFENAVSEVVNAWAGLDIVINNAGVAAGAPIEKLSLEDWRKTIDINLNSVFYGAKAFSPMLQKQGSGHMVVIASSAGIASAPEMASYSASKAGAISLGETLAAEMALYNVDVTTSCAAAFKSGLLLQQGSVANQSVSVEGIRRDMEKTSVTSNDIALYTLKSMAKRHVYSFPDPELRSVWRVKRVNPELLYKAMGWMYKNKMWKFKG